MKKASDITSFIEVGQSTYIRTYPRRTLANALFLLASLLIVPILKAEEYRYWVPFRNEISGPSNTGNQIVGLSYGDGNEIKFDYDHDGIIDHSLTLETGQRFWNTDFKEGTLVTASAPLDIEYSYNFSDFQAYEDGSLRYRVFPERMLGTHYVTPVWSNNLRILSPYSNNTLTIDADSNGSVDIREQLSAGQVFRTSVRSRDARIITSKPAYILVANHSDDRYDETYALSLLPKHLAGTLHVGLRSHPHGYQSAQNDDYVSVHTFDESSQVLLADNSIVPLDPYRTQTGFGDESIRSTTPVLAIFRSLVSGRDPWRRVTRSYRYTIPLLPEHLASTRYIIPSPGADARHGRPFQQLAIASFRDDNLVEIKCGSDGVRVLSKRFKGGESLYIHEDTPGFACWRSSKLFISATYPVQVTQSFRGWWDSVTEGTSGIVYLGDQSLVEGIAPIQLEIDDIVIGEDGGDFQMELRLNRPALRDRVFSVSTIGDTAVAGGDFVSVENHSVTVPKGESSMLFSIAILDDTECEEIERFNVLVVDPEDNNAESVSAVVTISDNDPCNTFPVISEIPAQSFVRDDPVQVVSFTASDKETELSNLNIVSELYVQKSAVDPEILISDGISIDRIGSSFRLTFAGNERFLTSRFGRVVLTVRDAAGASARTIFPYTFFDRPTVDMLLPLDKSSIVLGRSAIVRAVAHDVDGRLNNVIFFHNGELVHTDEAAPYEFNWTPNRLGPVSIHAVAHDDDGLTAESRKIAVEVVPNSPPSISNIDDIEILQGQTVPRITFSVSDAETADPDLLVEVNSLDSSILSQEGIRVERTEKDRTLVLIPDNNKVGSVRLVVTVEDDDGLSASTSFSLTINESLPKTSIELIEPKHREIFEFDPIVEIEGVVHGDAQLVTMVEFHSGAGLLGVGNQTERNTYSFMWFDAVPGEHEISARAINLDGTDFWSESSRISIAPSCNMKALVIGDDLTTEAIDWVRSQLFSAGVDSFEATLSEANSVRFAQDSRVSESALLIWIQSGDSSLSEAHLNFLREVSRRRTSLLFVGANLVNLASQLNPEDKSSWETLIHLRSNEAIATRTVLIDPGQHPISVNGASGDLQEFQLETLPTSSRRKGLDGETVLARAGNSESVVAFEDPETGARTVSVNLSLQPNPIPSLGKLVTNAAYWLACGTPCSVFDLSLAVNSDLNHRPVNANLGEPVRLLLSVKHEGECEGRLVALRYELPLGFQLLESRVERGSVTTADGLVVVNIGRMRSAGETEIEFLVKPSLAGNATHRFSIESVNEPQEARSNNATEIQSQVSGPNLSISHESAEYLIVTVHGISGRTYTIYTTDKLQDVTVWNELQTVEIPAGSNFKSLRIKTDNARRFIILR